MIDFFATYSTSLFFCPSLWQEFEGCQRRALSCYDGTDMTTCSVGLFWYMEQFSPDALSAASSDSYGMPVGLETKVKILNISH